MIYYIKYRYEKRMLKRCRKKKKTTTSPYANSICAKDLIQFREIEFPFNRICMTYQKPNMITITGGFAWDGDYIRFGTNSYFHTSWARSKFTRIPMTKYTHESIRNAVVWEHVSNTCFLLYSSRLFSRHLNRYCVPLPPLPPPFDFYVFRAVAYLSRSPGGCWSHRLDLWRGSEQSIVDLHRQLLQDDSWVGMKIHRPIRRCDRQHLQASCLTINWNEKWNYYVINWFVTWSMTSKNFCLKFVRYWYRYVICSR